MTDFCLTLFCNDPTTAEWAALAGIDRVGVDLEYIGKAERQSKAEDPRLSRHQISDLKQIATALAGRAALIARINPVHPGSQVEIDQVVAMGVDRIILPYFHGAEEVAKTVEMVSERCKITILVETVAAAIQIDEILKINGYDEVHIGLRDMSISAGLGSPMDLIDTWFLEQLCRQVRSRGRRLMVAGVAKATDDHLPRPASDIIRHQVQLRSTGALVSRAFFDGIDSGVALKAAVAEFRSFYASHWSSYAAV